MDDERIERALRQGPPDEPSYERSITADVQKGSTSHAGGTGAGAWYEGALRRGGVAPRFGSMSLVMVAVVLVVAAIVIRPFAAEGPGSSSPPDLLARLRVEDTMRIAVTGDHPQTTAVGGAVIGFDVDVARELGRALGLRSEVSVVAATDILGGTGGDWAIGLPSAGTPTDPSVTGGPAYYAWPSWLVTETTSAISSSAELDGATICAVAGSAGPAWLRGEAATDAVGFDPPAGAFVLERADDAACVDALRLGQAAAAVSARSLDDELAGQGLRPLDEDPAVEERRVIVVRGNGSDVASLLAALDEILRDPVTTQALADASRRAFGGRDLTEGVP
jgi:ABC-type amino acid transport substrate-binding protein